MQRTISLVLPIVLLLGTPSASAQTGGETSVRQVWLFLGLSEDSGREGFLRVVNHSAQAGEVRIEAVDDDGTHAEPVTLSMGASQTTHLNSEDLERGNASKGLPTGIGPGQGDWRLTLSSTLDLDALSYVRTDDGFVTSMHDTVPTMNDGSLRVAFLNPGSNYRQESHLRLINPSAEAARVRIIGTDDAGQSGAATVTADVPAGQARTFTAAELESGNVTGLSGALGDGVGKWRLRLESTPDIVAMSLLATPTGHLANLSTLPPRGDPSGAHVVPLFLSESDPSKRQGFLRVVNRSDAAGTVRIEAFDGSDSAYGPVTLTLDADQTRHFNSEDLEKGNASKGLSGGTGAGRGDWRLELTSDLDIEVLAYIRTKDGFVTSMHDLAPTADGLLHRVAFFNPGSNYRQVSHLLLQNRGATDANATIKGIDDAGQSPGTTVQVRVPAGKAVSLGSKTLEEGGDGFDGALGDGKGKWRLRVTSDQPIQALSLLTSPTGHLTNLSTVPEFRRRGGASAPNTRISGRHTIATAADQLAALNAADVDGDGDLDIVAAVRPEHGSDRIVWLENHGEGAFSDERTIGPATPRIHLASVTDFDVDGDPDVIYTVRMSGDHRIVWRENFGSGLFSDERVIVDGASEVWARMVAADVDADGDNDVIAVPYQGSPIVWYENTGNAVWPERLIAEIAHVVGNTLQVADFNGDGAPDIALVRQSETTGLLDVVWLSNRGGGGFTAESTVVEADTYTDGLLAADLDADGDADIVSISSDENEVAWFENLGGGRFSLRRPIASGADGVASVDASDFDGDGDLDLVCFLRDEAKLVWFRNMGDAGFSEERLIATKAGSPPLVAPADIDGDGDLDVLVGERGLYGLEPIVWYENLPNAVASIKARIVPGVEQLWVNWDVEPASDGRADYRFRVTAASDDDLYEHECTTVFSQGCTVTELTPGLAYRVTVAVEGDAFHAATLTAKPLKNPAAATDFSGPIPISTANGSRGWNTLLAVDLDGDGNPDLVNDPRGGDPRGGDPEPVVWWKNQGEGSFSERRVVSSQRVHAVDAADLDGDGDLDLLSAAAYDRELSWYENSGDGEFSTPRPIAAEPGAIRSVRTSDLDGDGDPDVIVPANVDEPEGEVRWYENRGGGTFGPGQRIASTTDQTRDLFGADLDGDGDTDLLGAYSGWGTDRYHQAEWFENLGRGRFSERRLIRIEYRHDSTLRAVDLDVDGRLDILVVGDVIAWYRNLGGGRYSGQRMIVEVNFGVGGVFSTADLDGDGDSDLIYNTEDVIAWHENLGSGVFSAQRLIADEFEGAWGGWSIVAADLDSDGDADVLARSGETFWFRNQGTARAPTKAPGNVRVVAGVGLLWVSWDPVPGLGDSERDQARYVVKAMAADGSIAGECIATELVGCTVTGLTPGEQYEVTVQAENVAGAGPVSAAVSVTVAVPEEIPGTRFGTQQVITDQALGVRSVSVADLDEDADLDALSASNWDDTIAWYENSATGFLPVRHVISTSADGATHVLTGDLDDDGDEDVISASFDDRIVAWHENLGTGTFAAQNVIAMDASSLESLDLADIDKDGDLDVLLGGPGAYGPEWYENQGGGAFAGPLNVSGSDFNSLAIASPADLDDDGDLDVLTTAFDDGSGYGIGWHENLGSGRFSPLRWIAKRVESTASLSTADLDGDGDLDILHGSDWEDTVAWYENRGGGDFHGRRIIATGFAYIAAVTSADLDADGDVDIVVASEDDDRVVWYENLERGRFSGANVITTAADSPMDAVAADLDSDGDLDILTASSRDSTVAWYENLGPTD